MNFIQEYAHLEHEAAIFQSHGHAVPYKMQQRMNQIESFVKGNLHPREHMRIWQEKERAVSDLRQQQMHLQRQHDEQLKRSSLEQAVGKVTQGILGQDKLTPQQLAAIVAKKPLRAAIPRKGDTQAERDAHSRAATRQVDPAGKGWTEKEAARRFDALTAAADNPRDFARAAEAFASTPDELRNAARLWKTEGVKYALQVKTRERYGEREKSPVLTEVSDADHRRATLATAYLADASEQASHGDTSMASDLVDEMPDELVREDSRRGDIALAFEKSSAGDVDG